MILKYMLLIGLILHNIVYSINMYFGRPSIPYFYSIPKSNVFQNLQDNFGSFNKKQDVQWNVQYRGNGLLQLPQVLNRNNEMYNIQQRPYMNRRISPLVNLINHYNWNIQAYQDLFQRYRSEKQKQYQEYLLKKQEEIKKDLERQQEQEKLEKEKMLRHKFAQRSKFLQRQYYEYLLHREYDEDELKMHQIKSDEN